MVKSLIYALTALMLCVGFFVFTDVYIERQFEEFHGALGALYQKIDDKSAVKEDANAVKNMWAKKKSKLHIFIPHNDISYVDYWLSEACALIYKDEYDLALGKIEVLLEITKALPDAYTIKLENVL